MKFYYVRKIITVLCITFVSIHSYIGILSAQHSTKLVKFKATTLCDSIEVFYDKARPIINNYSFEENHLNIQIRAIVDCATENIIGAFSFRDDTLNLLFTHKGAPLKGNNIKYQEDAGVINGGIVEMAACECYSKLEYFFEIDSLPNIIIFDNSTLYQPDEIYALIEPTYLLYESDTVNRIDSIGNLQGRWIYFNEKKQVDYEEYFENNESISSKYIDYFDNGELKSELIITNKITTLKYNLKGYLESQCIEEYLYFDLLSKIFKERKSKMYIKIETCFLFDKEGRVIDKIVRKKED